VLLVAALALVACGGSGTTATSSGSPSGTPSEVAISASPSPSWTPTMSPAAIPVVKPGDKMPPFSKLAEMFAYDTTQPLDFESQPGESQPGCTVETISYAYGGNQASGYLVTPEGEGPFPIVIYAPGWRTDVSMFLDDAAAMAKKGYAGLLLQEAPSMQCWTFDPKTDCRGVIENVTQERRGLDLIRTLPRIDAQRIGFVGWSNGAHLLGGVMAGIEKRVKAYALIGMARPASNYRGLMEDATPKGKAWDRVNAQLVLWDPVTYLRHNRGSAFLFTNGDGDSNAMQDAKAFVAAAPKPKTWKVYDGGHSPTPAAGKYIQAWLQENL
jgi:dienelactone hydrolase